MALRAGTLVMVSIVMLAACGSADTVDDLGAAPSSAAIVSETPSAEAGDNDATDIGAGGSEPTTPGAVAEPDLESGGGDLPGTPVAWAGTLNTQADLGVTGVETGDVLNVRAHPGADQPIVDRLAPLHTGARLTGRARMLGDAAWYEITADGTTGWVNAAFVDLVAGTTDVTAEVRDAGVRMVAETMVDLAALVAQARGFDDGYRITWGPRRDPDVPAEQQRRVVISDGPDVGDLGQITLDVVDTFDDSIAVERLVIFGAPQPDGETFAVRTVERTLFCDVTRAAGDVCA